MQRILVVRNDKIGDFMLAWPSFVMLKKSLPDARISVLVPAYTAPLAELCPWIDQVLIEPGRHAGLAARWAFLRQIRQADFQAVICLHATFGTAMMLWLVRIGYRLAPATRIAQYLFNHRIRQRRSWSNKPEYQYNLDLIRHFLAGHNVTIHEPKPPYFRFEPDVLGRRKASLASELGLTAGLPWAFIHPGSGGSANNLSLRQYALLATQLHELRPMQWVLTAGPGEEEMAAQLHLRILEFGVESAVFFSNHGVVDFMQSLACADLFIAGSTGPLHIAAAMDVPTVGFFPGERALNSLRWKPLNSEGRHLSFSPPDGEQTRQNMDLIDIPRAVNAIDVWLARLGS